MMPIHELLSRIRWDGEFGRGEFALGYFDRVEKRVIVVAFREVTFSQGDSFQLMDGAGQRIRVPFHRVREVYKDGRLIWHRDQPGTASREKLDGFTP